jgi:hypothetical protein
VREHVGIEAKLRRLLGIGQWRAAAADQLLALLEVGARQTLLGSFWRFVYSSGWMTWASTRFNLLPKVRLLFGIAFPHRDDVPRLAARLPHDHHQATGQIPDRLNACFAVVAPTVFH